MSSKTTAAATEPAPTPPIPAGRRPLAGPVLVAALATVAAILTSLPEWGGPGVTCDEPYHVGYGKRLVAAWRHQGLKFFLPANIRQNFDWASNPPPNAPPAHPPLGNWLLGWAHHLVDPYPDDPTVISVAAPRFVAALFFGLLVLLVGLATLRMAGPLAGTVAAAGVFLVPRVFGHAHLAALDMLTTFWFVAAVLAVIEADARGGKWWHFLIAGIIWGLAMLTRLTGVLVAPPVAVWMLWRLRLRAVVPLVFWGLAGLVTFFVGWPWLWLDPLGRIRQFLDTATNRVSIHVFYAGSVWGDAPDHQAPWHYVPVMFAVALPLGLLVLGLLGVWARRRLREGAPGYWLVMGSLALVLVAFSWPGRPIYDGVRLFLMAFPLWAVSVGIGAKWVTEQWPLRRWSPPVRMGAIVALVAIQGIGLILYHPCYLSHYSLLVGGLPEAERLGFEVTYWGDSVTEDLFQALAPQAKGQVILFGPSLAPYQSYLGVLSPSLAPLLEKGEVFFDGWSNVSRSLAARCRYAVIYRRKANLADLPEALLAGKVVAERRVLGVWVARVVESPLFRGSPSTKKPAR
jgi:hypothetical protein